MLHEADDIYSYRGLDEQFHGWKGRNTYDLLALALVFLQSA